MNMPTDRDFSWIWSAVYWIMQPANMLLGGLLLSITWNDFFAEPFGIPHQVSTAHAIGLAVGLRGALGVVRDTPVKEDCGTFVRAKMSITQAVGFLIAIVVLSLAKLGI